MFGYIQANAAVLTPEEKRRYRAFYCGLCDSLRVRHGAKGRVTLTYDLTFVAMLLTSLYEPETRERLARCAPHPEKRHLEFRNACLDYAADMNVALSYYKCVDDWRDERKGAARAFARLLEPGVSRVRAAYPRQMGVMRERLEALNDMETLAAGDLDACANCFGAILGEVFAWREDNWAGTLREVGASLGAYVYLLDAYEDLEADKKKGRFNVLASLAGQPDYEQRVRQILMMLMGDCTSAFERLPLLQDLELMRNVLYAGVWTRYAAGKGKSK